MASATANSGALAAWLRSYSPITTARFETAALVASANFLENVGVADFPTAADRLIGQAELALITDHPISKALDRDFHDAMDDPEVFGFVWLMLVRTRFIDEQMERAVRSGATSMNVGVSFAS